MDKILINGKFHTMDDNRQLVEAIAIKGDIIEKTGRVDEIIALKEENTKVYDLKGKTVVPGFNDSHVHVLNYGYSLTQVDLIGSTSAEEVNSRISDFINSKELEDGEWIKCRGWNQENFQGEKAFLTKEDLDNISTDHPIIATRVCLHVAVVNSKALEVMGINKESSQVDGGEFDLDKNGEPNGIFRENAIGLIFNKLPNPTVEDIKDMMINTITEMNQCGITSVGTDDFEALPDKDYNNVIKAFLELKEEDKLKVRVYEQCLLPQIPKLKGFMEKGYKTGWGDNLFKIGPIKLLLDGSLGARTAALVEPYSDDPTTKGITTATQEELDEIVELAHVNDYQLAIHAIGDKSMYMAFESIEKALEKKPKKDHRHGIVHCQITDEPLLNKFAELKAVAYIQPIFLDYDWKVVGTRIGEEREKTSYNWKTMIDMGVPIACSSDAPVEPFDVIMGIYEAVTSKDLRGEPAGGWMPEQRLSVDEAVYGYTMGGSYASFEDKVKGSLENGKLADMVILQEDIFNIDPYKIKDIGIQATILGGEVVFGEME